ncbi:hypothetical protein R3P38DRAFT_2541908 [Favolaschia claudopus]|uniref:Uncharacterized protein n=1 Tax=Favolaschia claudopus TaxID=2862362 RepID=A0AAW0ASK1_9AGAR
MTRKKPRQRPSTQSQLNLKQCQFCRDHVANLLQHEQICKINATNRRNAMEYLTQQRRQRQNRAPRIVRHPPRAFSPMDVDNDPPVEHDAEPQNLEDEHAQVESPLPERFIYVRHHRNADKNPEIIPLESSSSPTESTPVVAGPADCPFAPFRTFADYKFASRCVKRRMSNAEIDEDLKDMRGGVYSSETFITFRNHSDLKRSVAAARITNVSFESERFIIDFKGTHFGKRYYIDVKFRDPWKIMKRWICDETLASVSTWHSQEKYLCLNGEIDFSNPLYDEPWTGKLWREIEVRACEALGHNSNSARTQIRINCRRRLSIRLASPVSIFGWIRG